MLIGLFSDPHLGLNRAANTTLRSRQALRQHLFDKTMEVVGLLEDVEAKRIYCLGDLLDTFCNSEPTIKQAYQVLESITGCLTGNHDIENRTDSLGTLQLLRDITSEGVIINESPNTPALVVKETDAAQWVFIPHVLTQEIFCASLELALNHPQVEGMRKILCLHCNVNVPGYAAPTDTGSSLYLTEEWQDKLLEKYSRIFVGHEHPPRTYRQGKLQVLGNVFPLAFGEIADRYAYLYDDRADKLEAFKIFDAEKEFLSISVSDFLDVEGDYPSSASMVEIVGTIKAHDQADLGRAIAKFWHTHEGVFMLRNNTKMEDVAKPQRHENTFVPKTLPELVADSVENTPYREAYQEAVQAVRDGSEAT